MRHDLTHEKRQNEALMHLANAIQAVAAHCGMSSVKSLAKHVEDVLKADDSEPAEEMQPDNLPEDAAPVSVATESLLKQSGFTMTGGPPMFNEGAADE